MATQQYTMTIGGTPVLVQAGSLQTRSAIARRTECSFIVVDSAGTQHFTQGQPVILTDASGVRAYGGVVMNSHEKVDASVPNDTMHGVLLHDVTCADWHYLADKRRFPYSNLNATAGQIVSDMISQVLASEGVYAVRNLLSANQSDVETDTTGFATVGTGATISRDATTSWHGAASLKTVCDGTVSNQGFNAIIASTNYVAGATYTLSVYLKGAGTVRLFMFQLSPSAVIGTAQTITLTGAWTRYSVTVTMPNPLQATNYGLRVDTTPGGAQNVTFWADGLMIEPGPGAGTPVTNLFSAQQSDIESADLSGFDGVGSGVTISQDTTQQQHGAASLKVITNGSGTFQNVSAHVPIASFTPGQVVTISAYVKGAVAGGTLNFVVDGAGVGYIGGATNVTLTTGWQRVTRTVTLPGSFSGITGIGIRVDTGGAAQALTFWLDALQIEAGAALSPWVLGGTTINQAGASPWELGGTTTVQTGPTIQQFVSSYETCNACLDALATAAGFYWQIDEMKRLWFAAPATVTAPFTIDDTLYERGTLSVERAQPMYRNRQYVLGGTDVTAQQTETRKGDGNSKAFTMSYPIAKVPTVTVNAVAKTVGIKGVDTGKDWYWSDANDPVLAQDNAGTTLISTDTLQVTYFGKFPVVVLSSDAAAINSELGLEGAGTGFVDDVAVDATLTSSGAAFQKASALLTRFAVSGKVITFQTLTPGLKQGQLATLNLSTHGIANETALIEEVGINDDGMQIVYTVKAVEGPVDTNWVAFFDALTKTKSNVNSINLGVAQILALLQSVSETWTWTENVTETVTACPVFPWTFPVTFC